MLQTLIRKTLIKMSIEILIDLELKVMTTNFSESTNLQLRSELELIV